jgi:hypothetical protein
MPDPIPFTPPHSKADYDSEDGRDRIGVPLDHTELALEFQMPATDDVKTSSDVQP